MVHYRPKDTDKHEHFIEHLVYIVVRDMSAIDFSLQSTADDRFLTELPDRGRSTYRQPGGLIIQSRIVAPWHMPIRMPLSANKGPRLT
ncbi:hypothetical protein GW17_00020677 [Ensete ventricosum]|nr:hypothetical protein GW17_00020677 [Ensete ventricosum]RZS27003.1 hypothetical protein BHM03_00060431 [Ensete ventricosum]